MGKRLGAFAVSALALAGLAVAATQAPALSVPFSPESVVADSAGNVYFTAYSYSVVDNTYTALQCVFKLDSNGVITRVVGTGIAGYSGDGGPAVSAMLQGPAGLALDSAGNLYIGDTGNYRVRRVSPAGIITTVAGNGTSNGVGSGDGGPATSAELAGPGVGAVDAPGNLYIADGHSVRKVSPAGIITTAFSTGPFATPSGVAVDAGGNLYVSEVYSDPAGAASRVSKVTPAGVVSIVAGAGGGGQGDGIPATSALLPAPGGVAVDSAGNVYVAEGQIFYSNIGCRVRKVSPAGIITTVAGTGTPGYSGDGGPATSAQIGCSDGLALDATGNLYLADTGVRKVSQAGIITTVASSPMSLAGNACLGITMSHSGNFTYRQTGATYSITVSNAALIAGPTAGPVTVTDTLPPGLTVVSMAGTGWSCSGTTCTLNDVIYPGYSPSAITVTVNVAANATSPQVNQAVVSGGGSAPATASDSAIIAPLTITVTTDPVGLSMVVDGSPLKSPQTFEWELGDQHSIGVPSPQTVALTYRFASWSDGGAQTHTIATPLTASTLTANFTAPPSSGLYYYPVTPCRVADTRGNGKTGAFGPPGISGDSSRDFPISSSGCGIPSSAAVYSLNVTAVPSGQLTYLTVWPAGQPKHGVSTLNDFSTQVPTPGNVQANAALVQAGANGSVSVYASDATDVILDVNGYFAPPAASGLAFYPMTPCRVVDTRNVYRTGFFGSPSMPGGSNRSFPFPQSPCGVPGTAQAYSLNITAVPPGQLTYLTTWPTGEAMPVVSTLNDYSTQSSTLDLGRVVANAAIVPAGANGAVSVYVSDLSDLIIDINGYFGPPGGSGALTFYPTTPCRVVDTRGNGFSGPFGPPAIGSRFFPISLGGCVVALTAQAYSLNLAVVPPGQVSFLVANSGGPNSGTSSTLNDFSAVNPIPGRVVANAAIVAASASGSIAVGASDPTDLIIDINGYFAP